MPFNGPTDGPKNIDMMTTANLSRSELNKRSGITLEGLFFGAIVAIGAGVRLFGLAAQPLSPPESANAWLAWIQASGLADSARVAGVEGQASALLHSLQVLIFWLAGGGDATARIIPALAGIGLVALPWFWRPWLGRTVALILSLLFAIDPWLVAFSRRADGPMLSLLLFALLLTVLMYLERSPRLGTQQRRAWALLAFTSGLFLTSGALAFSLIPVLLVFIACYGLPIGVSALKGLSKQEQASGEPAQGDPGHDDPAMNWLALTGLFAVGLFLGSTAWFSNPQGLAAVGNSVGIWVRQFGSPPVYPFSWVILRFVADGVLALLLGLVGLWLLWRNWGPAINDQATTIRDNEADAADARRRWALFLTIWAAWGIVLLIVPGRTPSSLLVIAVALLFATAHFVGALIKAYPKGLDWTEAGIALAVAFVLVVAALFWLRILVAAPDFSSRVAAICLLIFAALMLLFAAYGVWVGWRQSQWLGGLLITLLLLAADLSSLVQLNHISDVTLPDGLFARETDPDVRLLSMDVATLSAQRVGDPGEIPVQVQRNASIDPVLAWYLRDMRRLTWVLAPDVEANGAYAPLALTLAADVGGSVPAAATDSYLGGEYGLRTAWQPAMLYDLPVVVPELVEQNGGGDRFQGTVNAYWAQRFQPLLRWLLFREVKGSAESKSVILWASAE